VAGFQAPTDSHRIHTDFHRTSAHIFVGLYGQRRHSRTLSAHLHSGLQESDHPNDKRPVVWSLFQLPINSIRSHYANTVAWKHLALYVSAVKKSLAHVASA
jgi:hypothetical protein